MSSICRLNTCGNALAAQLLQRVGKPVESLIQSIAPACKLPALRVVCVAHTARQCVRACLQQTCWQRRHSKLATAHSDDCVMVQHAQHMDFALSKQTAYLVAMEGCTCHRLCFSSCRFRASTISCVPSAPFCKRLRAALRPYKHTGPLC